MLPHRRIDFKVEQLQNISRKHFSCNLVLDRHGLTYQIDLHYFPWLPFDAEGGFRDSSEPIIKSLTSLSNGQDTCDPLARDMISATEFLEHPLLDVILRLLRFSAYNLRTSRYLNIKNHLYIINIIFCLLFIQKMAFFMAEMSLFHGCTHESKK